MPPNGDADRSPSASPSVVSLPSLGFLSCPVRMITPCARACTCVGHNARKCIQAWKRWRKGTSAAESQVVVRAGQPFSLSLLPGRSQRAQNSTYNPVLMVYIYRAGVKLVTEPRLSGFTPLIYLCVFPQLWCCWFLSRP